MGAQFAGLSSDVLSGLPAGAMHLPSDLARLQTRFLVNYPDQGERLAVLRHSPAAFRHILGLFLELDRADALPRHYRDLVTSVLAGASRADDPDAVDLLVIAYVTEAAKAPPAPAAWLPRLRRYFTEAQIIELALWIAISQGLTAFDRMVGL